MTMASMKNNKKGSIGRQRIPMAKIQKESHRQVTFSKRRAGLFKKASELCTLCGAEIAIIVFSPAKKPFSFGHPNVESVLDRYISRNTSVSFPQMPTQTQGNANSDLNARLTQVLSDLEAEKKKGQAMEEMKKARPNKNWWESPLEEMSLDQLMQMKSALEELSKTISMTKRSLPEMMTAAAAASASAFGCLERKVTPYHLNMMGSSGIPSIYSFGYGHGC